MYHFKKIPSVAKHQIAEHKHACESGFDTVEFETVPRGYSGLWLVPAFVGGIFAWLMIFYGLSLLF